MMKASCFLVLMLIVQCAPVGAQVRVVNTKGTVLNVDSSKWTLKDSNIYNKNGGTVGIGTHGVADGNAALEVKATDKGILIPRLALTATTAAAPLSAHVAGMMVYNTATAGSAPNNVTPGFYYSDGVKWIKVADAARLAQADTTNDAWINDNANTQVKLGTGSDGTTARPDSAAFIAVDNGRVGIGLINPSGILDIRGKLFVNNQQTVYNAAALGTSTGSLFVGNGGGSMTGAAVNNTGVGANALNANTAGTNNTGIGFNALAATTSGTFNTGTGVSALLTNTTGARNTADGVFALRFNTSGADNTAEGAYSLQANTTGGSNVALGTRALSSNTTAANGVALGYESQGNVLIPTATNSNTAVGYQALKGSAVPTDNIGNSNTVIGYQAMTAYSSANNNVAVGQNAMKAATSAVYNTALGNSTLEKLTTGSYNIAIGPNALGNMTTSDFNIALGYNTGLELTTTAVGKNTLIGYNTGRGITTGANNTILGANVTGLDAALNNNIILADGAGNRRINVDSLGNTGIGVLTPQSRLDVNGYIKVRSTDASADALAAANRAGMMRYNSTTKSLQYHNDTGWVTTSSNVAADTTNDAWVNDNANTQVKLNTLSDGITARPAGTEFVAKDDGKVGIGTTSPSFLLDVQGPSAIAQFKRMNNGADNNAAAFLFARARGTLTAQTDIIAGDYLGKVQFRGRVGGADLDYATFAYLATSTTTGNGRFSFFKGTGGAELMSVHTSSGNVGIGVATPGSRLSVLDSATGGFLQLADFYAPLNNTVGNNSGLRFGVSNTSKNSADIRFNYQASSSDNNRMDFGFNSIAAARLSIQAGGNVGVGTVTPQKRLHVNGAVQVTNELNVGGDSVTAGSAGTAGQILVSNGAGAAPAWKSTANVPGTIANAIYIQGTTQDTTTSFGAAGVAIDVPGVSYTHVVPAGMTQTLMFTVTGYAIRSGTVDGQASQGVFQLLQGSTKISSAFGASGDFGDLNNMPICVTLLKSVTLTAGTYTFKVQYKAWSDNQIVNFNPTSYAGYSGDSEAMLTKMQILVYNN